MSILAFLNDISSLLLLSLLSWILLNFLHLGGSVVFPCLTSQLLLQWCTRMWLDFVSPLTILVAPLSWVEFSLIQTAFGRCGKNGRLTPLRWDVKQDRRRGTVGKIHASWESVPTFYCCHTECVWHKLLWITWEKIGNPLLVVAHPLFEICVFAFSFMVSVVQ